MTVSVSNSAREDEPRALLKGTKDEEPATSTLGLVVKAVRMFANEGPAFTFRRFIWRIHHQRFEWRRRRLASRSAGTMIQFLNQDFELHESNEGLTAELRMFGVHEPSATDAYLDLLSPGAHIIDVGS